MIIKLHNITDCVKLIIAKIGHDLTIGTPLGIGKPNPLINAIWQHAKDDPKINMELFTALSLQVPKGQSLLEKRFLKPFTNRLFPNHPNLDYIDDLKRNKVPKNMKVTEFYMQSGKMLRSKTAQMSYTSSNYTHAMRDMLDKGMNVLMQMVAVKQTQNGPVYSLSCNTDLTLDMDPICQRKNSKRPLVVAMVNPYLPFLGGKAQVDESFFDIILDDESLYFEPFATPRAAVNDIDYSIGLLTSSLIKDEGTLQVGIGSLGDALIYCTKLRHAHNKDYLTLIDQAQIKTKFSYVIKSAGSLSVFKKGLYAASEMFVEGFAHLFDAGILKRKVYDDAQIQQLINQGVITESIPDNIIEILLQNEVIDEVLTKRQFKRLQYLGILKAELSLVKGKIKDESGKKYSTNLSKYKNIQAIQNKCLGTELKHGVLLHGGFFLGSRWFYQWLRDLNDKNRDMFQMTSVGQVNELYGNEALDRVQRIRARFINTCMKVDLLGAAASDTLDNNQVVSGVGGQYNFVAMAHALEDSRSILMLRSTHKGKNGLESNIVWKYTYCTIPRHLRDIVVTEYGIADLRGQSDQDCIKRLICIADSQFQEELRQAAISYNKLDNRWKIPKEFTDNTADNLNKTFNQFQQQGYFPHYPFGSDFTDDELVIIKALTYLKANTKTAVSKLKIVARAYFHKSDEEQVKPYLQRMDLLNPKSKEEKLSTKLLSYALLKT
jgi:acyl-CoA hydrolase